VKPRAIGRRTAPRGFLSIMGVLTGWQGGGDGGQDGRHRGEVRARRGGEGAGATSRVGQRYPASVCSRITAEDSPAGAGAEAAGSGEAGAGAASSPPESQPAGSTQQPTAATAANAARRAEVRRSGMGEWSRDARMIDRGPGASLVAAHAADLPRASGTARDLGRNRATHRG